MKRLLFLTITSALLFLTSCSTSPESKLIGTWKVQDVKTDFDESKVSPEMLSQAVAMQKETFFRIINDSVMMIMSGSSTFETQWMLGEDNTISYMFADQKIKPNKLGKVEDGHIIQVSNTPLGVITTTFAKE